MKAVETKTLFEKSILSKILTQFIFKLEIREKAYFLRFSFSLFYF